MRSALQIVELILALAILIGVHEFGHFLFAKLFKTRVSKFYLFFDVRGIRLFSTKHNKLFLKLFPKAAEWETDYGIGWLPFGGYCKIEGMIDESMDKSLIGRKPEPWELRAKRPWKRLLVMSGGVLMNFILAVLLFIHILAIWGSNHLLNEKTALFSEEGMVSYEMGFRTGDRIIALDGQEPPEDFLDIQSYLSRHGVSRVTVLRGDADTLDLYLDRARVSDLISGTVLYPAMPFKIDLPEDEPGLNADVLCPGDRIVALEDTPIRYFHEGRAWLQAHPDTLVTATLIREGETLLLPLRTDSLGRIGVLQSMDMALPELEGYEHRDYSYLASYPAGVSEAGEFLYGYILDLKLIFTPKTKAYKSVGSVVTMKEIMPPSWNWQHFLWILALLSVMLGVMNLLPIPGLDGGHIVFTLYEMLSGKKPSEKFMMAAQMVGMLLLVLLMLFALGNDFKRFF